MSRRYKKSFQDSFLVVHVIPESSGGGAELLVRELCKRQQDKCIDVIACFFTFSQRDVLASNESSLGGTHARSPLAVLRLRRRLVQLLSQQRQNATVIVHLHLTWGLIYGVMACAGLPVKIVYTEHNTSNRMRRVSGARFLISEFYRRLDCIICISNGVEKSLAKWLTSRASGVPREVIFNGARLMFPPRVKRPPMIDRRLKLVAVGALAPRKDFDLLLRAIERSLPYVEELSIVGGGPEYRRLTNLAKRLGIDSVCHFVGWQEDVASRFHDADALVMSSRWEGFGLVAVEALSTGLPVVAPALPGLSEVLAGSKASVLYAPSSVSELSAAIIKLYSMLAAGVSFERAAIKRANKFSLDEMTAKYCGLYLELSA